MSSQVQCPSCNSGMHTEDYEGIEIDRCSNCGGSWLDRGEISSIVDKREETFDHDQKVQTIKKRGKDHGPSEAQKTCPSCESTLETFEYAVDTGVMLDRCPQENCGLFLDQGELEKVQIVMEEYEERMRSSEEEDVEMPDVKNCPRCDRKLHQETYEGATLDVCPDCNGYWCDYDELKHITTRRDKEFDQQKREQIEADEDAAEVSQMEELTPELDCVLCGELMERVNYQYTSGIIIDSCKQGHGVWLDEGEIEDVQIFEEKWEDKEDTLKDRYGKNLEKVQQDLEQRREKNLEKEQGRYNWITPPQWFYSIFNQ